MAAMEAKTRSLMIAGTASHVGKSILVTALCRKPTGPSHRTVQVAKLGAEFLRLRRDGSEIGRAQVTQAEAAGIGPS